jgi:hypothetical protein
MKTLFYVSLTLYLSGCAGFVPMDIPATFGPVDHFFKA